MPYEHRFICPLKSGVHARPASRLEEEANRFRAKIHLVNERNRIAGDAKSVLSLVAADLRFEDPCILRVEGEDADEAFRAMKRFIDEEFENCDEPLPVIETPAGERRLPPCLRSASMEYIEGTAASSGIGQGIAVVLDMVTRPEGIEDDRELDMEGATDAASEKRRIDEGLRALSRQLAERLTAVRSAAESGILKAQLSVIRDKGLKDKLTSVIDTTGASAAEAIAKTAEYFSDILIGTGSAVLKDRVLDIQDICAQLMAALYGEEAVQRTPVLEMPSVCIARNLTPGRFLSLDRAMLKGLVLEQGGATSHTIILARSFGIPTLIQAQDATRRVAPGKEVVVDGDLGLLITSATAPALRYYALEQMKHARRNRRLAALARSPAETRDGRRIEVGANASLPEDVEQAMRRGADGVGLFRTEMLFMDRKDTPSEDEQVEYFKKAITAADGRPVILRTLDAGGDKPLPCLSLPHESNPFLGCRAVRLYPEHPELVDAHLRAMLRAAKSCPVEAPLRVMTPMVSTVGEMRWIRSRIETLRSEDPSLDRNSQDKNLSTGNSLNRNSSTRDSLDGNSSNREVELGMMIEVPSAAFILDKLCEAADFFSIGSNDLAQYFLAADRENPRVADIYNRLHPSFLRLVKKIVLETHARGKWVGLCGEMAGMARYLPCWIGLGLDEISLSPASIPAIKAVVHELDASACERLVGELMDLDGPEEIEGALDRFGEGAKDIPLLDASLVLFGSKSSSKEQAIKELVDNLYVTGRTSDPVSLEEAVWQREAVYATGLGHGFAIPHCKSEHVLADSLSLLTLDEPIAWGSVDEKPVDRVILLVIRASEDSETHMRIFSRLARSLMHETFRQSLRNAQSPEAFRDFLKETLECS